jgi:hypothetical protein
LAILPIAILAIEAASNRIDHLAPLVPAILAELNHIPPKTLRRLAPEKRGWGELANPNNRVLQHQPRRVSRVDSDGDRVALVYAVVGVRE